MLTVVPSGLWCKVSPSTLRVFCMFEIHCSALSKFSSDHLFPQKSEGKKDFLSYLTSKLWAVFYWQDQYLGRSHFIHWNIPWLFFTLVMFQIVKLRHFSPNFRFSTRAKQGKKSKFCQNFRWVSGFLSSPPGLSLSSWVVYREIIMVV